MPNTCRPVEVLTTNFKLKRKESGHNYCSTWHDCPSRQNFLENCLLKNKNPYLYVELHNLVVVYV
ncbi:hypothetical protein PP707_01725 [Acetobacter pasteurianus]|nr:hypothetical protein [Acetobacter pasteurianus]